MADLTITAASVVPGSGANTVDGTAGATITAGKACYLDTADNKYKLSDSDSATALIRTCNGIALNGASDGQPVRILTGGPLTIGATLSAGLAYYLSKTAGGICVVADIATGGYSTIIGLATSTTVLDVKIHSSGVAV